VSKGVRGEGEQWWMQDSRKRVSYDPRGRKFWKPHPLLLNHTHSEAHCLLNQQGLGPPISSIAGHGLVSK
jgi:hypothetical protein